MNSAAGNNAAQAKGRILVVDDDPNAVEILSRMLGREGYTCVSASSGASGLDALKSELVDVILLDVMMPEMDGLEVCERLRADEKLRRIPVILLTAKDDMETRSRGMALGVSEYLTKPINRRELFTRIDAQLHARAIDRQLSKTAEAVADPSKKSS
ncbi:MAG: response regulator [Deltaproteobacteria bacterium]|nr:response regulator [Deltaproteobacteria bacterium]